MNTKVSLMAAISSMAVGLAACSADPGPAPIEESTSTPASTSTTTPAVSEADFAIGIDEIQGGLNPHIGSDDSVFVRELADLVLPSAFIDGQLNTELLHSADLVTPAAGVAQTVRYELQSAAQWSDGTPITVADFQYLWRAISTNVDTKLAPYYQQISEIRSSQGGKIIDVDFKVPLAQWQLLFQHLLPAHSLGDPTADFASDLTDTYPASGWRFQFGGFDSQRGIITLYRNDRFWGENPARLDSLEFIGIRNPNQAAEMLRSGQVEALNITPTQTSAEMFELIPGTVVNTSTSDISLQLIATEQLSLGQRKRLQSLIDVDQLARLATGRAVPVSEHTADPGVGEDLPPRLRIGVNPEDDIARNAARILVDMLTGLGVEATTVESDAANLYGQLLPAGEVDLIFTRNNYSGLVRNTCLGEAADLVTGGTGTSTVESTDPARPELQESEHADGTGEGSEDAAGGSAAGETTASELVDTDTASTSPLAPNFTAAHFQGDNFSGYCDPHFQDIVTGFMAGDIALSDVEDEAQQLEQAQALRLPVVYDERLHVLGARLAEAAATAPAEIDTDDLGALIAWQEQEN
ncbi:MAG: ABC transporter substrate-binding protein [Corynebacterium sp.]|nr:ABC transporter substrate-binding protein [Corynebacterium sp.]